VLTRLDSYDNPDVQVISSDINNMKGLNNLLYRASAVFHCAGEINQDERMQLTNVEGTRGLLKAVKESSVRYLCHISSAGVIGPTKDLIIDENTSCNPIGIYEKTKFDSEQLVLNYNLGINTIILRPTNVFDYTNPGFFISIAINNNWKEKLKVFVSGKECAHIVDVYNVAKAALFFMDNGNLNTDLYFVSSDDDEVNTVADIYNYYMSINGNKNINHHLHTYIPYILRNMSKGRSLYGESRFSSDKIKRSGFVFERAINDSLKIVSSKVV